MNTSIAAGLDSMPLNDDSHWPSDYDARLVASATVRTLLVEDAATGAVGPCAAVSAECLDDGRRWRVRLDRSLRWSDGAHLSAEHVVRSVERAAPHPRAGLHALLDRRRAAVAVDDEVVEIGFARPVGFAPALLTLPQLAPSRTPGTRLGDVSLGDFRLVGRTDRTLTLHRQPHAADRDDAVHAIEFRCFDDIAAALGAFDRGELDLSPTTSFRVEDVARYRGHEGFHARDVSILACLEFGRRAPALREDADARAALGFALDRHRLARAVGGLLSPALGHSGAWPDGPADPVPGPVPPTPDQVRALRAALGTRVSIGHSDFTPNGEVVAELCDQLGELLGVRAEPRCLSYEEYVRAVVREDFALLYTLTTADFPHPASVLLPWRGGGAQARRAGVADPELDRRVDLACAEPDPVAARRAWRHADDRWLDLMPRVPLARVRSHSVQRGVGRYAVSSAGIVPFDDLVVRPAPALAGKEPHA